MPLLGCWDLDLGSGLSILGAGAKGLVSGRDQPSTYCCLEMGLKESWI